MVRVHVHDQIARIEMPANTLDTIISRGEVIIQKLQQLGYEYVTADLQSFESG